MEGSDEKIICSILFIALTLGMVVRTADILFPKADNRYYILDQYIKEQDTDYDVQVYDSCHAYTSFDPIYLEKKIGTPAFVYANPGEIIPATYVRMAQQFREYTPKVAVVDIWGINPYETYDSQEKILEYYLPVNIEALPYSEEKQEVIGDFDTLDPLEMNFPLVKYKDRLLDGSLTEIDFKYDFNDLQPYNDKYYYKEMTLRFANNGFLPNDPGSLEEYPTLQKTVQKSHFQKIEPDIEKYIRKIIALCEENGVELIFYRAPYISTEAELRKLKHLQQICDDSGVTFIDLEKEIAFDYSQDFSDQYHLSIYGAQKATQYLSEYILKALDPA